MLARSIPVQQFIDANAGILTALTSGGARTGFDAALRRLSELADVQSEHRVAGSGELSYERRLVRGIRRKHMFPIIRMARTKVPEAAKLEPVRMPKLRSNAGVLVRQARDMAQAVTPFRQLFHEAGMPADFIERLLGAATELENAATTKLRHFAARVGATANIDIEADTLRIELSLVDSLVLAALEDHPEKRGEWRTLVHGVRSAFRKVPPSPEIVPGSGSTPEGPSAGVPAAPVLSIAA